ncbi:MAG: NifB/NifX family molybdenum-iron cluster-binding protein [Syntrophales bacterium]|nr:NifB/NifX family molybdenum-iron cluster-binding protein [Syntrophales bacterium]
MKLAMPVWNDSLSTVLDFADCLLIVDYESGTIHGRSVVDLAGTTMAERVARLRELGIRVLLCGAVSRPLDRMIRAAGIEIIPFLRGRADDVLDAYLSGHLLEPGFMLPGCPRGYGPGRGMGRRKRGDFSGPGRNKKGWNI